MAQFIIQNFQVQNDENMNCDYERMKARYNEHPNIHNVILNREF